MTRADAAQLATPSASTISTLSQLHPDPITPTSDTPPPRSDILPPPLNPPANPLCSSLISQILLKKLPHSSAADHGGGAMNILVGPSLSTQEEADTSMLMTPLMLLRPLSQVVEPLPFQPSYALHSTVASHSHAVHGSWGGASSHSARRVIHPHSVRSVL